LAGRTAVEIDVHLGGRVDGTHHRMGHRKQHVLPLNMELARSSEPPDSKALLRSVNSDGAP
jgi:hypothetical protein